MADSRAFPASLASKAKRKNAPDPASASAPCTAHPGKKRPAAKLVGPPTRLERSALDYAIACLARGRRPESLEQLRAYVDGDAYSRAVQEVALALWSRPIADARRIVRARLALYLRTVRRAEAWERYERPFHETSRPDPSVAWARIVWRVGTWRPLWLDAPAHDPLVSPRQRRERCPECGRSLLVSPMPVCIQCHRESAQILRQQYQRVAHNRTDGACVCPYMPHSGLCRRRGAGDEERLRWRRRARLSGSSR